MVRPMQQSFCESFLLPFCKNKRDSRNCTADAIQALRILVKVEKIRDAAKNLHNDLYRSVESF